MPHQFFCYLIGEIQNIFRKGFLRYSVRKIPDDIHIAGNIRYFLQHIIRFPTVCKLPLSLLFCRKSITAAAYFRILQTSEYSEILPQSATGTIVFAKDYTLILGEKAVPRIGFRNG